jgi:hypothetical protein
MTKQSLQDLIFSNESKEGISEAIRQAIAEANAAGLRPAYEPAFSQLRTLEKMADEKGGLDLEFHRAVVEVLYTPAQPGTWLRQKALNLLQRWEINNLCDLSYTAKWREWLSLPAELGMTAMLSEDDFGTSMRCNSPFMFLAWKKAEPTKEC